ncbi:MAG: hypothetical protein HWE20_11260, partial [Gammaproteobacteria bacterium]|nr:hypothetical protein [Gammaproteobacteria bacterium]
MRWALVCSIILHLIAVAAIYLAPRDDQSPLSYVEVSLNNLAPTDAPQPIPTNNTAPTEQHKPSKAD